MENFVMPLLEKEKLKGEYLNGSYSELAEIIGIDAVLKLHARYRGTQIFLPVELFSREFIAAQIVNEYNGHIGTLGVVMYTCKQVKLSK